MRQSGTANSSLTLRKGTWFGIAQVMCIGRRSPAYEARLRGDVLQVLLVAPPPRLERGGFLDWNALGALICRRGWLGFLILARCRSGLACFISPDCHHLGLKRPFKCARILPGQRVLGRQGTLRPGKRFLRGGALSRRKFAIRRFDIAQPA